MLVFASVHHGPARVAFTFYIWTLCYVLFQVQRMKIWRWLQYNNTPNNKSQL